MINQAWHEMQRSKWPMSPSACGLPPDLAGPATTNLGFWLELTGIEAKLPGDRRDAFLAGVLASLRRVERDGELHFSARIVVASGQA